MTFEFHFEHAPVIGPNLKVKLYLFNLFIMLTKEKNALGILYNTK